MSGIRRAILMMVLLFIILELCITSVAETVWGDLDSRFASKIGIEYCDRFYAMRSRITSILFMGIDKRDNEEIPEHDFRSGGQADFLMLVVIDDNHKTIAPILINRDTMCEITVLNVMGNVSGIRRAQICLSHGFGDGKEESCTLTMEAVGRLIYDLPITHYYAMNMDGIAVLNDTIGGVEVTLADDFTSLDPEMKAGKTLKLEGVQAEYYTRNRYNVGDQSNQSRLSRQREYIEKAGINLKEVLAEDPNYILTIFDNLDAYITTDMGRGYVLNISKRATQYETLPVIEIEGKTVVGKHGFVEFYPDEEGLQQTLIDLFCEE